MPIDLKFNAFLHKPCVPCNLETSKMMLQRICPGGRAKCPYPCSYYSKKIKSILVLPHVKNYPELSSLTLHYAKILETSFLTLPTK
jgi:hypothetical protein